MFDLTPPVCVSKCYGFSVIRIGRHFESCQIYMDNGIPPRDFVRCWLAESACLCDGARRLGLLATQIEHDVKGRLGCVAGWMLLVDGDDVVVHDATMGFKECERTFEHAPEDWWRCIKTNKSWFKSGWRMKLKDLKAWNERIHVLFDAIVCTHQLIEEERNVVAGNKRLVAAALDAVHGGKDLRLAFPRDYVKIMRFIGSSVLTDSCGLGGWAGVHPFESEVEPRRSVQELVSWIRGQCVMECELLTLLRKIPSDGIALDVVRVEDVDEGVLMNMINEARLPFRAVDLVAFIARDPLGKGSHLRHGRCARDMLGYLLENAANVILGVCNGTAWATFPIRPNEGGRAS